MNVKYKALAGLIKTFLEQAGDDKFLPSQFHTTLFRFHVLEDSSLPDPGLPPFYSKDFFQIIKQVHVKSSNIFTLSEKEWYKRLLEENCTMETVEEDVMQYIMCRVERDSPMSNWEQCWKLARLSGLGPSNITFLFKMLHQILPTQERLARVKPSSSSSCKMQGCSGETETLHQALVLCDSND